jgi:hypothetical protein
MSKIDFKKELKQLYQPTAREFTLVEVPPMNFLMIDGKGDPGKAPAYGEAVAALYGVAYKLKFMGKKAVGQDYVVPPLEGLWWAEDMAAFVQGDRDNWQWTMMIMQPEWITAEMFAAACEALEEAKNPTALPKMRLESYDEGLAVQIMHIGSYADEAPTLARLHNEFLPQNGLVETGKHHEIYLSYPRKVAPEKLKTVLRQPVRRG